MCSVLSHSISRKNQPPSHLPVQRIISRGRMWAFPWRGESWVIRAFEEKMGLRFQRGACQPSSLSHSLVPSFKETSPERGRAPQEDIASHISGGHRLSLISLQSPVPSHKYARNSIHFSLTVSACGPPWAESHGLQRRLVVARPCGLLPIMLSNEACLFIKLALMDFERGNYEGWFTCIYFGKRDSCISIEILRHTRAQVPLECLLDQAALTLQFLNKKINTEIRNTLQNKSGCPRGGLDSIVQIV